MAADPLLACLEQLDAAGNDAAALLRALKALKTALVGNRARKLACCEDMSRLRRYVLASNGLNCSSMLARPSLPVSCHSNPG